MQVTPSREGPTRADDGQRTTNEGDGGGASGQRLLLVGRADLGYREPVSEGGSFERFRAESYFRSLDGLRALSILAVIAFHCALPLPGLLGRRGYMGVTLFFVISGFLITTLLLRERDDTGMISLKNFYVRRTLRIFPLYYAVLLAFCAATLAFDRHTPEGTVFWHHLPFFVVYLNNWVIALGTGRTIFAFSWSLATEEQFYLFWPWAVALTRRKAVPLTIITALMFVTWTMRALVGDHTVDLGPIGNHIVTSVAPGICMGCILAFALHEPRSYRVMQRLVGWRGCSLVALLAVLATTALVENSDAVLLLSMTALLASVVIQPDHVLRGLLDNAGAREIGRVSYGMYLMFTLVLNVGTRVLHVQRPWLQFGWTALATLVVAHYVHRFYETPFLRLRKRFSPASRARPA